jgi:hypothetical protein
MMRTQLSDFALIVKLLLYLAYSCYLRLSKCDFDLCIDQNSPIGWHRVLFHFICNHFQ